MSEQRSQEAVEGEGFTRSWALFMWISPLIAIAVIYARVRFNEFVWDDPMLSLLPVYRDCDLGRILTSAVNGFEYLPVRDLSLCVDHALFGSEPAGFHLMNVLIFMASALLVQRVLRSLFALAVDERIRGRSAELSWICTLLFCVHPLQVEPVSFVSCRNTLLALLFVMASLAAFLRDLESPNRLYRVLSVLAAGMALFSKATALPVALLIVLVHLYACRDDGILKALKASFFHLAMTAAALVIHLVIASQSGAMSAALSVGDFIRRLPRVAFIPQFYVYKTLWPLNLSVEYVLSGVREHLALAGLSAMVFVLLVGVVIWRGARQRTLACLLCLAALAALVPILNLFPTYPPVADRYAQIPLLFMLCFFVVPVMVRLSRAIGLGVVATLLFVMGGLSFQQVNVWRNNETLFSHAVDVDSRALTSLQNLAHLRWWRGSEDLALENFKQLSESRPDDGEFELFSGWYAIHQKNFSEAEAQLRVAEGMNTKPYFVHMAFGDLYAAQGRVRLARERYERSRQDAEMRLQRDARAGMTLRLLEQRRARVR